jgi:beta-mannosidase
VASGRRPLIVTARSGTTLSCIDVLAQFLDLNHAYRFGPPTCELVSARLLEGGHEVASTIHFPLGLAPLLANRSRDVGLVAALSRTGDDLADVTIDTTQWAIDVHIDVPGWQPSDNHFHLAPGASRRLRLRRTVQAADLAGQVHVMNAASALPLEARP